MAEESKIENRQSAIPRWAKELGEETWDKVNELLHDGYDVPDIIRELDIPAGKLRSLQIYARKFGPRRRLLAFAKFKDAMLQGAVDCSPDFAASLTLIAKCAMSPKVKPSTQLRAVELLTKFTQALTGMMGSDDKSETKRQEEETKGSKLSADEVVTRILDVYGLRSSGNGQ